MIDYSKTNHLLNNIQLPNNKQLSNRTMATLYNKTALKKIKKDDLVQMFLDQQAKHNNLYLAFNRSSNAALESLGDQEAMLKENKKLKAENEKLKKDNDEWETEYCRVESNFESLECDNKKLHDSFDGWTATLEEYKMLKVENKKLKDTIVSLKSSVDDLREARDKRDQQIKELKQQVDYAYKQLNELMSKVTLLKDELESDSESDSESEEEEDECVCCGTNFILNEELRHASPERRSKYEDYFGSESDMGDICPECIDKIY